VWQQLVAKTNYRRGKIKLTRFKLFDWFHTLDDMLNDSEMNQAFDDYKRAEHIQETFHARNRRI
jgi:hypothetical protein